MADAAKKTAAKKTAAKKTTTPVAEAGAGTARHRRSRPFPPLSFPEALALGQAVQQHAAGNKVRRVTLFENMGRSADNVAARTLVTASNQYKITEGSYKAEFIELTADGRIATADNTTPGDKLRSRFRLGIENNPSFKSLYDTFSDNRLPATSVLEDHVRAEGMEAEYISDCVATFIVNAKSIGLLKPLAGAERLLTLDHALDDLPQTPPSLGSTLPPTGSTPSTDPLAVAPISTPAPAAPIVDGTSLDGVCFYISPIGDADSEDRKHADLFMEALVAPALSGFGLRLVRADQIAVPGLITAQIIDYIVRSKLVIADLSFHNPNVFYELALRHAVRKPIVQVIRQGDRIPFDLNQFRTIIIDNTDIYSLVPQLDTYRAEIGSQIRMALESTSEGDNPLTAFYPDFWRAMGVPAAGGP